MLKKVREILNKKPEELPTNEEIYKYLVSSRLSHFRALKMVNDIRSLIENKK